MDSAGQYLIEMPEDGERQHFRGSPPDNKDYYATYRSKTRTWHVDRYIF